MAQDITPRDKDYSKWYTDVIAAAALADYAPVKGCMIIRPYGYAIWEKIQAILDAKIKETGHENAYFPLFIPKSFFNKEAKHVEGFAKECAVVTHSRLKASDGGIEVDPSSKLEEELIVRPTSETIINAMFAKWVQSWRDLPLLINQWANIVRWEMRTRLFLRTAEFLWQEGHTAHATLDEAEEEARKMLEVYREFVEGTLAVPVIKGAKSESERFAGAIATYTIEAMMQDRKALQGGTSHNLGQNFAKAFGTQFQDKDGNSQYVWQTSWGVSTRLIGAVIMTHGDDYGLILPPEVAPVQVVMVPIYKSEEDKRLVYEKTRQIESQLKKNIRINVDLREQYTPGFKFYEWEKKGVPLRVEIGPKDIEKGQVTLVSRLTKEKQQMPFETFINSCKDILDKFQSDIFKRAKEYRDKHLFYLDSYEAFKEKIEDPGGFFYLHWCGLAECEARIKEETKATIRCIPFDNKKEDGKCILCGKKSQERVIFAKNY